MECYIWCAGLGASGGPPAGQFQPWGSTYSDPPKGSTLPGKIPSPWNRTFAPPLLSLTCTWCLQVVAEALAKAEELNGPELAAKFRSQPRDPLAARLQVMSHV